MKELLAPASTELVIERSHFLCLAQPVTTPQEARDHLKFWKERYLEASHVVHAFQTGPAGSVTTGYSDDGEPPGTAGRPLMDVLAGSGITGILWGVVRWFGGVKLGTGGLVKAYQTCGKALLPLLVTRELVARARLSLPLTYPEYEAFKRHLASQDHRILAESFDQGVQVEIEILLENKKPLESWVQDLTRGRWKPGLPS